MKDKNIEAYMRYDIYCNLLFNFLAELYEFYNGNRTNIENFCDIKTWVRMHKLNWLYPVDPNENIDGYSEDFRKFINSYIKQYEENSIVIGNSDGLEGVKTDLFEWKKFLTSPKGGAWEHDEIEMIMNPQRSELLSHINELRKTKVYDFAIVVYSGHGGYDRNTIFRK